MRYIRGFNYVLLAVFATLALVLGVVSLIMFLYIDDYEHLRPELPFLLICTAWFWVLSALSGLSVWCYRRQLAGRSGYLPVCCAQIALIGVLAALVLFLLPA